MSRTAKAYQFAFIFVSYVFRGQICHEILVPNGLFFYYSSMQITVSRGYLIYLEFEYKLFVYFYIPGQCKFCLELFSVALRLLQISLSRKYRVRNFISLFLFGEKYIKTNTFTSFGNI